MGDSPGATIAGSSTAGRKLIVVGAPSEAASGPSVATTPGLGSSTAPAWSIPSPVVYQISREEPCDANDQPLSDSEVLEYAIFETLWDVVSKDTYNKTAQAVHAGLMANLDNTEFSLNLGTLSVNSLDETAYYVLMVYGEMLAALGFGVAEFGQAGNSEEFLTALTNAVRDFCAAQDLPAANTIEAELLGELLLGYRSFCQVARQKGTELSSGEGKYLAAGRYSSMGQPQSVMVAYTEVAVDLANIPDGVESVEREGKTYVRVLASGEDPLYMAVSGMLQEVDQANARRAAEEQAKKKTTWKQPPQLLTSGATITYEQAQTAIKFAGTSRLEEFEKKYQTKLEAYAALFGVDGKGGGGIQATADKWNEFQRAAREVEIIARRLALLPENKDKSFQEILDEQRRKGEAGGNDSAAVENFMRLADKIFQAKIPDSYFAVQNSEKLFKYMGVPDFLADIGINASDPNYGHLVGLQRELAAAEGDAKLDAFIALETALREIGKGDELTQIFATYELQTAFDLIQLLMEFGKTMQAFSDFATSQAGFSQSDFSTIDYKKIEQFDLLACRSAAQTVAGIFAQVKKGEDGEYGRAEIVGKKVLEERYCGLYMYLVPDETGQTGGAAQNRALAQFNQSFGEFSNGKIQYHLADIGTEKDPQDLVFYAKRGHFSAGQLAEMGLAGMPRIMLLSAADEDPFLPVFLREAANQQSYGYLLQVSDRQFLPEEIDGQLAAHLLVKFSVSGNGIGKREYEKLLPAQKVLVFSDRASADLRCRGWYPPLQITDVAARRKVLDKLQEDPANPEAVLGDNLWSAISGVAAGDSKVVVAAKLDAAGKVEELKFLEVTGAGLKEIPSSDPRVFALRRMVATLYRSRSGSQMGDLNDQNNFYATLSGSYYGDLQIESQYASTQAMALDVTREALEFIEDNPEMFAGLSAEQMNEVVTGKTIGSGAVQLAYQSVAKIIEDDAEGILRYAQAKEVYALRQQQEKMAKEAMDIFSGQLTSLQGQVESAEGQYQQVRTRLSQIARQAASEGDAFLQQQLAEVDRSVDEQVRRELKGRDYSTLTSDQRSRIDEYRNQVMAQAESQIRPRINDYLRQKKAQTNSARAQVNAEEKQLQVRAQEALGELSSRRNKFSEQQALVDKALQLAPILTRRMLEQIGAHSLAGQASISSAGMADSAGLIAEGVITLYDKASEGGLAQLTFSGVDHAESQKRVGYVIVDDAVMGALWGRCRNTLVLGEGLGEGEGVTTTERARSMFSYMPWGIGSFADRNIAEPRGMALLVMDEPIAALKLYLYDSAAALGAPYPFLDEKTVDGTIRENDVRVLAALLKQKQAQGEIDSSVSTDALELSLLNGYRFLVERGICIVDGMLSNEVHLEQPVEASPDEIRGLQDANFLLMVLQKTYAKMASNTVAMDGTMLVSQQRQVEGTSRPGASILSWEFLEDEIWRDALRSIPSAAQVRTTETVDRNLFLALKYEIYPDCYRNFSSNGMLQVSGEQQADGSVGGAPISVQYERAYFEGPEALTMDWVFLTRLAEEYAPILDMPTFSQFTGMHPVKAATEREESARENPAQFLLDVAAELRQANGGKGKQLSLAITAGDSLREALAKSIVQQAILLWKPGRTYSAGLVGDAQVELYAIKDMGTNLVEGYSPNSNAYPYALSFKSFLLRSYRGMRMSDLPPLGNRMVNCAAVNFAGTYFMQYLEPTGATPGIAVQRRLVQEFENMGMNFTAEGDNEDDGVIAAKYQELRQYAQNLMEVRFDGEFEFNYTNYPDDPPALAESNVVNGLKVFVRCVMPMLDAGARGESFTFTPGLALRTNMHDYSGAIQIASEGECVPQNSAIRLVDAHGDEIDFYPGIGAAPRAESGWGMAGTYLEEGWDLIKSGPEMAFRGYEEQFNLGVAMHPTIQLQMQLGFLNQLLLNIGSVAGDGDPFVAYDANFLAKETAKLRVSFYGFSYNLPALAGMAYEKYKMGNYAGVAIDIHFFTQGIHQWHQLVLLLLAAYRAGDLAVITFMNARGWTDTTPPETILRETVADIFDKNISNPTERTHMQRLFDVCIDGVVRTPGAVFEVEMTALNLLEGQLNARGTALAFTAKQRGQIANFWNNIDEMSLHPDRVFEVEYKVKQLDGTVKGYKLRVYGGDFVTLLRFGLPGEPLGEAIMLDKATVQAAATLAKSTKVLGFAGNWLESQALTRKYVSRAWERTMTLNTEYSSAFVSEAFGGIKQQVHARGGPISKMTVNGLAGEALGTTPGTLRLRQYWGRSRLRWRNPGIRVADLNLPPAAQSDPSAHVRNARTSVETAHQQYNDLVRTRNNYIQALQKEVGFGRIIRGGRHAKNLAAILEAKHAFETELRRTMPEVSTEYEKLPIAQDVFIEGQLADRSNRQFLVERVTNFCSRQLGAIIQDRISAPSSRPSGGGAPGAAPGGATGSNPSAAPSRPSVPPTGPAPAPAPQQPAPAPRTAPAPARPAPQPTAPTQAQRPAVPPAPTRSAPPPPARTADSAQGPDTDDILSEDMEEVKEERTARRATANDDATDPGIERKSCKVKSGPHKDKTIWVEEGSDQRRVFDRAHGGRQIGVVEDGKFFPTRSARANLAIDPIVSPLILSIQDLWKNGSGRIEPTGQSSKDIPVNEPSRKPSRVREAGSAKPASYRQEVIIRPNGTSVEGSAAVDAHLAEGARTRTAAPTAVPTDTGWRASNWAEVTGNPDSVDRGQPTVDLTPESRPLNANNPADLARAARGGAVTSVPGSSTRATARTADLSASLSPEARTLAVQYKKMQTAAILRLERDRVSGSLSEEQVKARRAAIDEQFKVSPEELEIRAKELKKGQFGHKGMLAMLVAWDLIKRQSENRDVFSLETAGELGMTAGGYGAFVGLEALLVKQGIPRVWAGPAAAAMLPALITAYHDREDFMSGNGYRTQAAGVEVGTEVVNGIISYGAAVGATAVVTQCTILGSAAGPVGALVGLVVGGATYYVLIPLKDDIGITDYADELRTKGALEQPFEDRGISLTVAGKDTIQDDLYLKDPMGAMFVAQVLENFLAQNPTWGIKEIRIEHWTDLTLENLAFILEQTKKLSREGYSNLVVTLGDPGEQSVEVYPGISRPGLVRNCRIVGETTTKSMGASMVMTPTGPLPVGFKIDRSFASQPEIDLSITDVRTEYQTRFADKVSLQDVMDLSLDIEWNDLDQYPLLKSQLEECVAALGYDVSNLPEAVRQMIFDEEMYYVGELNQRAPEYISSANSVHAPLIRCIFGIYADALKRAE